MSVGITQRFSRVMHLPCIQQSVEDCLVGLEDGAVFVKFWHADLVRNIFKSLEVFCKVGTKVLQFIAVVIYQPTVLFGFARLSCHLHSRRSFHHLTRERF